MRKVVWMAILAGIIILGSSCSSLAQGALGGALSSLGAGSATASTASAVADFQSGELLCSSDSGKMTDAIFRAAKVLTPASAATKNQAEALFVADGSKEWVNYAINSRKAVKSDLTVGATVFYLYGWSGYDKISADSYRKEHWKLGYISSTDSLYKDMVEIAGENYSINYLRIPTDPVK